jgi:thiol-disulfide isomerase/thioredoxin
MPTLPQLPLRRAQQHNRAEAIPRVLIFSVHEFHLEKISRMPCLNRVMPNARPYVLIALLMLCCSSCTTCISLDDIAEKGSVQILTSATWDSFLAGLSKPLVVLHYAPWCGHCKRLLPDFEVASRRCASTRQHPSSIVLL